MEFKKSGFDEQDSMKLARVASMYQNVADQEITAGEAANFIVSQMKAYNMTASDSEHIIDAVNEVSNRYAVSSADIATNIGKASAAMATGNVTYEQSIGLMTAMTEITRNGAKSARGLVSIQSRYNQILDDSSTTGKKLTAWYKEHNIEIKDQNGQLRSFFEVGKDVSKIWNELSDNEKKYYLNAQAGANQSQNLASLMRNYQTAIDATNTALDSNGSAAKENARYMESMEGKLQNLKSAWENFSRTMVDSDLLKTGIDSLTKALDFLSTDAGQSIIKLGVAFGGAYLAAKPFIGLFKGASALKNMSKFAGITRIATKELKNGKKHIEGTTKGFAKLSKTASKGTPALGKFGAKAAGLATVFSGGAVGWGLLGAAGITAGILALNKAIDGETDPDKRYEKSKEKLDELRKSYESINDEIKKYSDGKNDVSLSKSEEERLGLLKQQKAVLEEQLKLQEEIANKRWEKKTKAPQVKSKEVKEKSAGKSAAVGKGGISTLKGMEESTAKQLGHTNKLTSAMKDYEYTLSKVGAKYEQTGRIGTKSISDLSNGIAKIKDEQKEWVDHFGGVEKMPKEYRKIYDESKKVTDAYDSLSKTQSKLAGSDWSKLGAKDAQQATQAFKDLGNAIGVSVDESGKLESINYGEFVGGLQAAGFTADQTKDALIQLGEKSPDVKINVEGVEVAGKDIEGVIDFMDKLNGTDADATVDIDGTDVAVKDIKDVDTYLKLVNGTLSVANLSINGSEESVSKASAVKGAITNIPQGKNSKLGISGAEKSTKKANSLDKAIRKIPSSKVPQVRASVHGERKVDDLKTKINSVPSFKSVVLSVGASISGAAQKLMNKLGFAKGTKDAPEGLAEVNEQGWELIRDAKTGKLRVAGGGKRTVTHLNEGDIVYTHAESMRMLSNEKDIEIPQHKKGKKLKKAQSQYDKKVEKVKKEYESKLKDLEHKKEIKHWSDEEYQKQYNKIYQKYNKKVKAIKSKNKKVKKVKGLGKEARYDIEESRASIAHDKATDIIESMIEDTRGTSEDLTKALTRINAERKAQRISLQEYEDYRKQAFKQHIDYDMKMFESNQKTYDSMKKELDEYYKSGKITAADYYDTLEQLVEKQFEKEKEVLEKKKEETENTYSLARAYVNRQIEVLEKQNEKQEEQNDLMEKQNDLLKAKNKRVRVYREGIGFVYEQDTEAIREATKALKEYQTEEESAEMKAWKEVLNLFDEMDALAEISRLEQLVGATASQLFGSFGTNLGQWTNWLKDNLATTMGLERLIGDMDEIVGYQNMMGFLGGTNQTISTSQISSYIDRHRFASGTLSAPSGLARVGEQGYEIALLGKGDAVMPHNVSKNLMDWGNYSPLQFAKATSDVGNNIYNFDRLVLPNVSNANEFMKELERLPNKAIQFGTSRV